MNAVGEVQQEKRRTVGMGVEEIGTRKWVKRWRKAAEDLASFPFLHHLRQFVEVYSIRFDFI